MTEPAQNPYVGPVAFRRNDTRGLFGRDDDLRRLMIQFVAQRIVLLYSPSGAGKTSLVQARMIPALESRDFLVRPVIRVNREPQDRSFNVNRFIYSTIHSLEMEASAPGETRQGHPAGPGMYIVRVHVGGTVLHAKLFRAASSHAHH